MTALLELPSPTASDSRSPEIREWEDCADYYEGPIGYDLERNPAMSIVLEDERVGDLVAENYHDPDAFMGRLQGDLRQGDRRLAANLMTVIRNEAIESSARTLALVALAGARVRTLDSTVCELIREMLGSREPNLQFTAVAAASDLSRRSQVLLAGVIRALADSNQDQWVQRAAKAFLSRL